MVRQAFEKHGVYRRKVTKEGIYASAAIAFIKRKDIWIKNSFLISIAEMLGSNPRLKSAFFFSNSKVIQNRGFG